MSEISKNEQTAVVKQAMEYERSILKLKRQLEKLNDESFRDEPEPPIRKIASPNYSSLPTLTFTFTDYLEDEIKNNPSLINKLFSAHPFKRSLIVMGASLALSLVIGGISLYLLLPLFYIMVAAIPAAAIYWISKQKPYKARKDFLAAELVKSPDYVQAKAEAEHVAAEKQAEFDRLYEQEKETYDTVTLPQYNAEQSAWNTARVEKIAAAHDKLTADRKAQSELYETSMIIPMQYREIKALEYIYQLMATSDYNIKEAIDMYDKELQRQQEAARIRELQIANELAAEQNAALEEQRELQVKQLRQQQAAAAMAIGHEISRARKEKRKEKEMRHAKKSLWGTAACPYGRRNSSGFAIGCDMRCQYYHHGCDGRP